MPKSKELMELIAFQAPRALKEKLEAYCKTTGYNMSYAIRKAVEDQILTPKFTWEDFMAWMERVDKVLGELLESNRRIEKALEGLRANLKS